MNIIRIQANPTIEEAFRIELISKVGNKTIMTAYEKDCSVYDCIKHHVSILKNKKEITE